MNTKKTRPIISAIYLAFCLWLTVGAFKSYRQLPLKEKYYELQEITYRQAYHIMTIYWSLKNGKNVDDNRILEVKNQIESLDARKELLISEIRNYPDNMNEYRKNAENIHAESETMIEQFENNFSRMEKTEEMYGAYRQALRQSIDLSKDCSIFTSEITDAIRSNC